MSRIVYKTIKNHLHIFLVGRLVQSYFLVDVNSLWRPEKELRLWSQVSLWNYDARITLRVTEIYIMLNFLSYLSFYLNLPTVKFRRGPVVKIPQQIFHLQHPSLVTVAMHGGSLPSPVHPIGMSAQPGSLKTAFYITAYNERGFISVLSKCQSSFNDLLSTPARAHSLTHRRRESASIVAVCGSFLHCWRFQ